MGPVGEPGPHGEQGQQGPIGQPGMRGSVGPAVSINLSFLIHMYLKRVKMLSILIKI